MSAETPVRLSIVIPTYNRAVDLRRTLDDLVVQTVPTQDYEVIVADDGSSDDTKDVVASFESTLRVQYVFQPDEGFRAAGARNLGARQANGDVIAFLDTGTLPGPTFVQGHLDAHAGEEPLAVVGYVYGYQQDAPRPEEYSAALARLNAVQLRERFTGEDYFVDMREPEYASVGDDLSRRLVPCLLFFSANISLRRETFWSLDGFDEGFTGWGMEDIDLGYRLWKAGIGFAVTRDGWAVEVHERTGDDEARHQQSLANGVRFLEKNKFGEPMLELAIIAIVKQVFFDIERYCATLLEWTEQARSLDVTEEIERATADLPKGTRVVVLGSGGTIPAALPPSLLVDFDRELIDAAVADGRHTGHHNLGIRTPLEDGVADVVVVTSRLKGVWDAWGEFILNEANRLGKDVRVTWQVPA